MFFVVEGIGPVYNVSVVPCANKSGVLRVLAPPLDIPHSDWRKFVFFIKAARFSGPGSIGIEDTTLKKIIQCADLQNMQGQAVDGCPRPTMKSISWPLVLYRQNDLFNFEITAISSRYRR